MLDAADESLRSLLEAANLPGRAEIVFEAPTRDWADRHGSAIVLNLFLHDIREQIDARLGDWHDVRDSRGQIIERAAPVRRYDLSYLVTAWTANVADEHRLLSAALGALAMAPSLPPDHRRGLLADYSLPVPLQVACGTPEANPASVWDIWSALGTGPRASLDVVLTVPLLFPADREIGPPVAERTLSVGPYGGAAEVVTNHRADEAAAERKRIEYGDGCDEDAEADARPASGPGAGAADARRRRRVVTEQSSRSN